jgi:hypothetical protein
MAHGRILRGSLKIEIVRFFLVAAWLSVLSCSSGGPWRRVETPHFVLRTDLDQREARRAGWALEATRDALISGAGKAFRFGNAQTEVYILANGLEFERYFGKNTHGLFAHDGPPQLFLYGPASRWELRRTAHFPTPSVLRHEMAHQLTAEVFPFRPRWFSEGLAQFMEPIYYAEDEKHIVVGAINYQALRWYRSTRTTRLADALDWTGRTSSLAEREIAGLYGISWLFVHWLYHRHQAQLYRFIEEMRKGTSPERALQIALPDFDPASIDRALFQYQRYLQFNRFDENMFPLTETPLSESDLRESLLPPAEVARIEERLAEVSMQLAGRSPNDPHAEGQAARPNRARYAALPPLPQYPCPTELDVSGPVASAAPASRAPATSAESSPPEASDAAPAASETPARTPVAAEISARVVRGADEELRGCYDDGLRRNLDLGGKVTLQFTIDAEGAVLDLRPVCTSLPDAEVVNCMASRFRAFRFPKPTAPLSVIYPIVFTPRR